MPRRAISSSRLLATIFAGACALAGGAPSLAAQDFDAEAERCADEAAAPDIRIRACSSLLGSDRLDRDGTPGTYYNRGNAYYDKGQYELAIRDYDRAIGSGRDEADAYANRGSAYRRLGRYDRAIQDFDRAIRLNPNDPGAYINRALAYEGKSDDVRAIEDYDQALRLDPGDSLASYNRGLAHGRRVEYERAVEDFDQAIRLLPNNALAYFNRGLAHGRNGQYDNAIRDFDQAIRLDPSNADAYLSRGLSHGRKAEYDRAVQDYNRSIRLRPNDAVAYNALAWLRATAKDPRFRDGAEAVRLARKAVELDGKNPTYNDTLGAAYIETGDEEKALASYRQAIAVGGEPRTKVYQAYLKRNGFYTGAVDGRTGPETDAALRTCLQARCKPLAD